MQDTARTFSGSTSAKAKYEIYMEALHFTRIIEKLSEAKNKVGDMQSNLDKFQKAHKVQVPTNKC